MARSVTKKEPAEIDVINLKRGQATLWLVGETPFYCNRMAAKAKRQLLFPAPRMTTTQRATKLKHAPFAEYRDSPYLRKTNGPTKFLMVGSSPKLSIAGAALRMPTSVSKTEIKQMVSVPAEYCDLYGVPRLDMSVVRMAGISRTPDIRTRARIERWAMPVDVRWIEPMLNETKISTLAQAAGIMCGIGDWRLEKGGSNGGFRLAERDDPELRHIMETGGYLAQEEALRSPECANPETEELLDWYLDELSRRGIDPNDEQPEDIEVADEEAMIFGAGEEQMPAPGEVVKPLPMQNGPEV